MSSHDYSMHLNLNSRVLTTILAFFTLSTSALAETWELNDVSYLFPLPTRATDSSYVKAKDLIPARWFTEALAESNGLPFLLDATQRNTGSASQIRSLSTATYNNLRLLAVRLDPCFKDLHSDPCRPQLRAVWQPMDKNFSTVDASMHTFYDLTSDEFKVAAEKLLYLKAKYKINTSGLPLQVHPGFKQKGFSNDLFSLFKAILRPDHASRVAFMRLIATEFRWSFLSFDVKNDKLIPIQIPLRQSTQQTFATHGQHVPAGTLELSAEDRTRIANGESQDRVLLDYALRVENPRVNIPGTTDCLSCHVSTAVKGASSLSLGMSEVPNVGSMVGLIGKYNLQNVTKNHQDQIHFRAFGYVFREPSLSDRTIIETALVADALNHR